MVAKIIQCNETKGYFIEKSDEDVKLAVSIKLPLRIRLVCAETLLEKMPQKKVNRIFFMPIPRIERCSKSGAVGLAECQVSSKVC